MQIILASSSPFRRAMLHNAGVAVSVEPASIDERAVEAAVGDADLTPADLATVLAEAKAVDVSDRNPGALVIGCDQTLSLDGQLLHKPADMEEARRRLLALSGKTHRLDSAVVLVRDGKAI